jgi:hypothetical protein
LKESVDYVDEVGGVGVVLEEVFEDEVEELF